MKKLSFELIERENLRELKDVALAIVDFCTCGNAYKTRYAKVNNYSCNEIFKAHAKEIAYGAENEKFFSISIRFINKDGFITRKVRYFVTIKEA